MKSIDVGWEYYEYWSINELINDIDRNSNEGKGKPEPLKHELQ